MANTAEKLWNEVKDKKMNLYSQMLSVSEVYESIPVDTKTLYLRLKKQGATAAISALEEAINPHPNPDEGRYTIIASENNLVSVSYSKSGVVADVLSKFDEQKQAEAEAKLAEEQANNKK